MSQLHDLINAMDEAIITIQRLGELGPVIDESGPVLFPNAIALLALITQQAGHLERLSSQLAQCVLPGLSRVEGRP
jgi:hypothetical protein